MWVFSVPMRNWNSPPEGSTNEGLIVFSVPMRNWNFHHLPTKEKRDREFSAYLWGIETLYLRSWSVPWSRFQRTYEELKQGGRLHMYPSGMVFSVPMRNWNAHGHHSFAKACLFSAYLWGIETPGTNTSQPDWLPRFQRTYEELKRK